MTKYNSSQPTPDGQPPEADEERLGFFSFLLPAAGNAIQAAKWNADQATAQPEPHQRAPDRKTKTEYLQDAHAALDGCARKLNQAKADTEERIEERDKDSNKPKRRGWLW
jgi:hypothetical protein